MKKLRIGTFNLFQFVEPPYCWYESKNTFSKIQWSKKTTWIQSQIKKMDCDIIGFQEVFSNNALEKITQELGFKYFITVDKAKTDKHNPNIFITTTVALASKYPILEIQEVNVDAKSLEKHKFIDSFEFSRKPIKALIKLSNTQNITVYVNHFKSNRLNELEYMFTKNHTLKEKKDKTKNALNNNISKALKQRLCETSSLYEDFKKVNTPIISVCDLNDKEYSLSIEALTNKAYHEESLSNDYVLHDVYNLEEKEIYNPHPEEKERQRMPTSYFQGKGNVLDYIFVSNHFGEKEKHAIAKINSYELFNTHLLNNHNGSILESDHAQVVSEIIFIK